MLQTAERVGDFEIVRPLGKGGMGEVYEARQENPPRPVALKVLAPWLAEDPEALERFEREADVLARLDHPGIVSVITRGRTDAGLAYYTMKLVRGTSLSRLMRAAGEPHLDTTVEAVTPGRQAPPAGCPRPTADLVQVGNVLADYRKDRFGMTARIGLQVAEALAHAHREGFLHRDVKPGNLMIDADSRVYLVDFGLTRALGPGADQSGAGQVRGTPWYMSPEQARGDAIDARSDIYSLGVALYELATGGIGPFTASRDDSPAVLAQVKRGEKLPLRVLAPEIPRELENIVLRCIEARPKRRYQSADALAEDLRRFGDQARGRAPAARPRRPVLRAALLGGTATLLCGVLAVAYLLARPGADVGPQPAAPPATEPSRGDTYPSVLRARPVGLAVSLLKDDFTPLWGERVSGEGRYYTQERSLIVSSPPNARRTLIRLDHDPEKRPFEFLVELRRQAPAAAGQNELGVFFGLRRKADKPRAWHRCFALELDDPLSPDKGAGQVRIGTARIEEGDGTSGGVDSWRPLAASIDGVPLSSGRTWHQVRVRAVGDRVTILVDEREQRVIDLADLRRANPKFPSDLTPEGALGLWVGEGVGHFAAASVKDVSP